MEKDLKNVQGIAFRDNQDSIIKNEPRKAANIEDFPYINWDHFDVERYIAQPDPIPDKNISPEDMRFMPVITARGCAFRCSFCHFVFWDDPYRNRKPKSV